MIPNAYRVSNWNALYENNRTKEIKRLLWVPVPNSMDGAGYTELVDHPNGAAHFGAWIAILEIASRQEVRGEIPQSSAGTSQALARISRLPVSVFDEVFPRLISLQWVELTGNQQLGGNPQEGATLPQEGAGKPPLKEGIEQKGKKPLAEAAKKKHRISETELPQDWHQWAFNKYNWDWARSTRTFEKFLNYWQSKGEVRADWEASWRTWVMNDEERNPSKPVHVPLPPVKFWVDDLLDPK